MLVMGALSPRGAARGARGRRRRRRLERARSCDARRRAGGGRVHVKLDTGHGAARHARPGAGVARASRAARGAPACELVGRDDPLRDRRRARRRRLLRRAARRASRAGRAPLSARAPGAASCTPPTAPRCCATPARTSTWCAAAIAIYGMDPFGARPGGARARAGARAAAPTSPRSSRARPGRAPATAGASSPSATPTLGVLPIGYGDGWRRGLSNNADVLIGGRRHPLVGTVSMDNITVDLGAGAGASAASATPAILIGAAGRRADHRRGGRRAAWRRSTTRSPAALTPRVPRALPPRRRARSSRRERRRDARACAARRCAGEPRAGARRRRAWLVGGAVRDALLGRATTDLDVVVDGDPARGRARASRAPRGARPASRCRRSSAPGASSARDARLAGRRRAAARRLARGRPARCATSRSTRSPSRSPAASRSTRSAALADLAARRLRMAAPARVRRRPAARAAPRAARRRARPRARRRRRCARPRAQRAGARAASPASACSSSCAGSSPRDAAARRHRADARARRDARSCCPSSRRCAASSRAAYHHLDVLRPHARGARRAIALDAAEREPGRRRSALGEHARAVAALLAEPLADELTRGEALRWGALLHDAAKPLTRAVRPTTGASTFIGHDARGAELAREVLARLRASERLRAHVAALARHHLRLGFLVHEPQPLARRDGLRATCARATPVEVDVTLLSVADRLATRGDARRGGDRRAPARSRARCSATRCAGARRARRAPLLRGDELARRARDRARARGSASCSSELAEAQYAGEVATREQALAYARGRRAGRRARSE